MNTPKGVESVSLLELIRVIIVNTSKIKEGGKEVFCNNKKVHKVMNNIKLLVIGFMKNRRVLFIVIK